MLTCKQVSELVSQSPQRRLSFGEWLGIRFHLMICKLCARFTRQIKFIARATDTFMHIPEECLDHNHTTRLSTAAQERIKKAINEI